MIDAVQSRIDADVCTAINQQLDAYEKSMSSMMCKFPSVKLSGILNLHADRLDDIHRDAFLLATVPLKEVFDKYKLGLKGQCLLLAILIRLFNLGLH